MNEEEKSLEAKFRTFHAAHPEDDLDGLFEIRELHS